MKKYLISILFTFSSTVCLSQLDSLKMETPKKKDYTRKKQLGLLLGIGYSKIKIKLSDWQQGNIDYRDSLKGIKTNSISLIEFGFAYYINVSKPFSIQPAYYLSFDGGKHVYQRNSIGESVDLSTISHKLSLTLIFKYYKVKTVPFLSIAPTILYMQYQHEDFANKLPLNKVDFLGEISIGLDFPSPKLKCIISPQIKYSHGFLNAKNDLNNIYSNTIEKQMRRAFIFTISFRA
jgi:hypothetical protein